MTGSRLLLGLLLAVLAGLAASFAIDRVRGEQWDAVSALIISLAAVLGSYFFVRNLAKSKI